MTMPGPMGAGTPSPVHYGRAVGDWQIGARYAVRGDLHLHHAGGETQAQVAVWRFRGTQPLPRFLEALATDLDGWSRLRHGNLTPLLDVGRIQGELTCYWVQESNGLKLLAEALANGQVLDASRALHIALQLGHALVEVHRGGLIHGDLDPANVGLVGTNDRVRLSWGGLANRIESAGMDSGRGTSRSNAEVPPEAAGGLLTPAADIFGLAALLHRMLIGRGPFDEEGTPGLDGRARLVGLPTYIPADLVSLLAHSLRRDPASRPPLHDFLNVLVDVERRMTGLAVSVSPAPAAAESQPGVSVPASPPDLVPAQVSAPPQVPAASAAAHAPEASPKVPGPPVSSHYPGHGAPLVHSVPTAPPIAGTSQGLPPPTYGAAPGFGTQPMTSPPIDQLPPPMYGSQAGSPRIIGASSMTKPPPPPPFTPSRQPAPPRAYDPSLGNQPSSYTLVNPTNPGRTIEPSLAPPSSYQVAAPHPPGYRPRRSLLSSVAVGSGVALTILAVVAAATAVYDHGGGQLFGASAPASIPVEVPPPVRPAPPPLPVDPVLTIYSQPAGASVLEGEEPLGVTPLRVPLLEEDGARTFTVALEGYQSTSVVQEFVDGTPIQHVRLTADAKATPTRRAPRRAARRRPAPRPSSQVAAPEGRPPAITSPPPAGAPAAEASASPATPAPAAADEVGPSAPPTGLRTTRSPGQ